MANINGLLQTVLSEAPDLRLVAFADLAAGMVLASKSHQKVTQETLDQLCNEARAFLSSDANNLLHKMNERSDAAQMGLAWHGECSHIFIGSPSDPTEALLIVAENPANPMAIAQAGKAIFSANQPGGRDG